MKINWEEIIEKPITKKDKIVMECVYWGIVLVVGLLLAVCLFTLI